MPLKRSCDRIINTGCGSRCFPQTGGHLAVNMAAKGCWLLNRFAYSSYLIATLYPVVIRNSRITLSCGTVRSLSFFGTTVSVYLPLLQWICMSSPSLFTSTAFCLMWWSQQFPVLPSHCLRSTWERDLKIQSIWSHRLDWIWMPSCRQQTTVHAARRIIYTALLRT